MRSRQEIEERLKNWLNSDDLGGFGYVTVLGTKGSALWTYEDEHVSFSPVKRSHTPTWYEMCELKEIFYRDDEAAYQVHPRKKDYVDIMDNCLHLWGDISKVEAGKV